MSVPTLDPPSAPRIPVAWVFVLLAVLGLLAGVLLWRVSVPISPHANPPLSVSAQPRTPTVSS